MAQERPLLMKSEELKRRAQLIIGPRLQHAASLHSVPPAYSTPTVMALLTNFFFNCMICHRMSCYCLSVCCGTTSIHGAHLLAPLWIPPLRQPDSPEFSLRDFDKSLRMRAESLTYFLMSEYCKCAQRLCILCTPPSPYSNPHHPNCPLLAHTHTNTCR